MDSECIEIIELQVSILNALSEIEETGRYNESTHQMASDLAESVMKDIRLRLTLTD